MVSAQQPSDQVFQENIAKLSRIDDPVNLMERASLCLRLVLRRAEDAALLERSSIAIGEIIGELPFDAPEAELRAQTRKAAQRCIQILLTAQCERPARSDLFDHEDESESLIDIDFAAPFETAAASLDAFSPSPEISALVVSGESEDAGDIAYCLPEHLSHLLHHIVYDDPQPPPSALGFSGFDELCAAAIDHRLDRVLTFFHKHNPDATRPLPLPFLLSPEFAANFKAAVRRLVTPAIRESRLMRMLSTTIAPTATDTDRFWGQIDEGMQHLLLMAWNKAWDDLKLIETHRGDETVYQVKKDTKTLRAMLSPEGAAYDIPHISNREIDLFRTLFDPAEDWWPRLAEIWRACHILYEQEMHPRVFQQQAREGALRDALLAAFKSVPEPWSDFLLLLCHHVFPRITTKYLARFSYNIGQDQAAREARMPYLMRHIKQAEATPAVREAEHRDELQWLKESAELRKFLKGQKPVGKLTEPGS
jgi:hypothetical protein